MGLADSLQPLVSAAKYSCSVFLWKNGNLGKFYSLLVVDWLCTLVVDQVRDFTVGCVWRRLWAWILWRNVLGSMTGKTKTGGGVRSNQVKHLGYIKCLNVH